jgi:hypothetical protein
MVGSLLIQVGDLSSGAALAVPKATLSGLFLASFWLTHNHNYALL